MNNLSVELKELSRKELKQIFGSVLLNEFRKITTFALTVNN